MNAEVIKQFYSKLGFPGTYSFDDIKFYDEEGIHNIYLKQIDSFLAHGQEVLDVGCGTGMVSNLFAYRYRSNFTAVDFSDSIDYAREFANNHCINNRCCKYHLQLYWCYLFSRYYSSSDG